MDREAAKSTFGDAFPALLAAARAQAPWAWRDIYDWLAPSVAGYLRMQGGSEAEDLVSDVFLGAYRGIHEFVGDEPQFRSWVFVIAHRRVIDDRRRRSRRVEINDGVGVEAVGGDAADEAAARMGEERVVQLCARLASDQRDVLLLRIVGDLTVEQVAATVGKSVGAVKALQRRGLSAIRKILSREGVPL